MNDSESQGMGAPSGILREWAEYEPRWSFMGDRREEHAGQRPFWEAKWEAETPCGRRFQWQVRVDAAVPWDMVVSHQRAEVAEVHSAIRQFLAEPPPGWAGEERQWYLLRPEERDAAWRERDEALLRRLG